MAVPHDGTSVQTSDSQGRFQLTLPRATRQVRVAVGAPGFAFRMLSALLPTEGPLAFGLSQQSGTLILETSEELDWSDPDQPKPVVLHNGGMESLTYLGTWVFQHGARDSDPRRFTIPFMEPADYTACTVARSALAAFELGILPAEGCAKGHLPENGELRLTLGKSDAP